MGTPTKDQAKFIDVIVYQLLKLIFGLVAIYYFGKVTSFLMTASCEGDLSALLIGLIDTIFGTVIIRIAWHLFPAIKRSMS